MKIISGINSIRGLGGMKIKKKIGGVGQDFDRDRKYHFCLCRRLTGRKYELVRQVYRIANMKYFRESCLYSFLK